MTSKTSTDSAPFCFVISIAPSSGLHRGGIDRGRVRVLQTLGVEVLLARGLRRTISQHEDRRFGVACSFRYRRRPSHRGGNQERGVRLGREGGGGVPRA